MLVLGFHAGFFSGVGSNGVHGTTPPTRRCGVCSPREFLCSEAASECSGAPKKAANLATEYQENITFKILGGWGGGGVGDPKAPSPPLSV